MRQRLAIVVTIVVVIGALVALSSASYVHVERTPDSEFSPDRSTMNSGATGTRALYDFLHEAGYQVIRWREPPINLLNARGIKPATFVIIGRTRRPIEDEEARLLLRWVASGGRLVIVDRLPDPALIPPSVDWLVTAQLSGNEPYGVSADNSAEVTQGVDKLGPAQPTLLTDGVEAVQPSRFAGVLKIAPNIKTAKPDAKASGYDEKGAIGEDTAPLPPPALPDNPPAPVVHIAEKGGALLLDIAHGKGRVVLLAEPFLLANNGISSADNLQLAINLAGGGNGLVAFDEFHQGRSASQNALFAYFAGTPVMAMCAQLTLLILVFIWTRGRRFARPLPLPQVDRRSSLEFVASMAELQERARAYDLALENIYLRTRRVLARYAGADNFSTRSEIAQRVATRSRIDGNELETLMRNCEDVINGAPTSSQHAVQLARRLRALEGQLGLRMRSRDTRQAANKI
ncbi:MAG: hypothetical protein QOD75_603 [Blastocatellia bacterium]|jgi:hypothetical protein|nr:hypothetical protein [Blastocatellia bacterium]